METSASSDILNQMGFCWIGLQHATHSGNAGCEAGKILLPAILI